MQFASLHATRIVLTILPPVHTIFRAPPLRRLLLAARIFGRARRRPPHRRALSPHSWERENPGRAGGTSKNVNSVRRVASRGVKRRFKALRRATLITERIPGNLRSAGSHLWDSEPSADQRFRGRSSPLKSARRRLNGTPTRRVSGDFLCRETEIPAKVRQLDRAGGGAGRRLPIKPPELKGMLLALAEKCPRE